MKVIVEYKGQTYTSAEEQANDMEFEAIVDSFYDILGEMTRFKMVLEDGGVLLMPKEAIQRSLIFLRK